MSAQTYAAILNLSAGKKSAAGDEIYTPKIFRNIEEISRRYKIHVESEINEDLNNQKKQVKKIQELKKTGQ